MKFSFSKLLASSLAVLVLSVLAACSQQPAVDAVYLNALVDEDLKSNADTSDCYHCRRFSTHVVGPYGLIEVLCDGGKRMEYVYVHRFANVNPRLALPSFRYEASDPLLTEENITYMVGASQNDARTLIDLRDSFGQTHLGH